MNTLEDDYSSSVAHLFHGIVDQSVAGIYLIQDGTMRYVNHRFAEFFGTTPERFMGRPLADVAPPLQRESLVLQYERRIRGEDMPYFTIRTKVRDKGMRLIELHGNRVEYRGRPAVVGIAIDITEREEANAELIESRAQLRELMSTIETIQDVERTRIALELHDDIGGLLTALKFDVARIKRRLERMHGALSIESLDELSGLAEGINGIAQEAISSVRRISEELRPSAIAEVGLYAAIRDHVEKFSGRFGIDVRLELPADVSAGESTAELDLYRMIQEALTNVARHASADSVAIELRRAADTLILVIEDNGRGYQGAGDTGSGLGLVGLRERVRRLGGRVDIGNGAGGGARIEVRVPWRFEG
ncbi:PAS domain-containing sensor histidine kinase [Rhodococcus sp. C26F]